MDRLRLKNMGDPKPIFSRLKNWVNDGQPEELINDKLKKNTAEAFTWLKIRKIREIKR